MFEPIKQEIKEVEFDNQKYYYATTHEFLKVVKDVDLLGKVKYFGLDKCWKCHGTGSVHWQRDNGICYECRGSGRIATRLKLSKNRETIQRRIDKKERLEKEKYDNAYNIELNKTLEKYGEKFYLILNGEKNTYETKEDLKQKGSKFEGYIKAWWNKSLDGITGYTTIEVITSDTLNEYGRLNYEKLEDMICKKLIENESK